MRDPRLQFRLATLLWLIVLLSVVLSVGRILGTDEIVLVVFAAGAMVGICLAGVSRPAGLIGAAAGGGFGAGLGITIRLVVGPVQLQLVDLPTAVVLFAFGYGVVGGLIGFLIGAMNLLCLEVLSVLKQVYESWRNQM